MIAFDGSCFVDEVLDLNAFNEMDASRHYLSISPCNDLASHCDESALLKVSAP